MVGLLLNSDVHSMACNRERFLHYGTLDTPSIRLYVFVSCNRLISKVLLIQRPGHDCFWTTAWFRRSAQRRFVQVQGMQWPVSGAWWWLLIQTVLRVPSETSYTLANLVHAPSDVRTPTTLVPRNVCMHPPTSRSANTLKIYNKQVFVDTYRGRPSISESR